MKSTTFDYSACSTEAQQVARQAASTIRCMGLKSQFSCQLALWEAERALGELFSDWVRSETTLSEDTANGLLKAARAHRRRQYADADEMCRTFTIEEYRAIVATQDNPLAFWRANIKGKSREAA